MSVNVKESNNERLDGVLHFLSSLLHFCMLAHILGMIVNLRDTQFDFRTKHFYKNMKTFTNLHVLKTQIRHYLPLDFELQITII